MFVLIVMSANDHTIVEYARHESIVSMVVKREGGWYTIGQILEGGFWDWYTNLGYYDLPMAQGAA